MSELKRYLLEDVVEKLIDYRGKTPVKTESGIPLITAKVIKNGRIETPTEFIAEADYKSWMTRGIPEIGDVVLTTEAPLGEVAQINTKDKIALAQRVITLRGKENVLDSTYLKYFLFSPIGQGNLKAKETGSTVTGIKQSELRKVEIYAPDFETQQEIAQILTSLDDKIELNLQMNQTLEAMAQALFKEWFVDFNFPSSEHDLKDFEMDKILEDNSKSKNPVNQINPKNPVQDKLPKGWRTQKLGTICEVKYGKDHKHLGDGNIPVYGSGGIMRFADKALYENESILIPRKGTLTNLFYVSKPFWSVDTMFYTIIKDDAIKKYLFYLLKTLNLASMNVGSAVPSLTTEVLNKIDILIPENSILVEFEKIISSFYSKMEENKNQIEYLTQTRDTLLPKLMSGKIRLNRDLLD
jgi:type I restriction enzyme, S subunit